MAAGSPLRSRATLLVGLGVAAGLIVTTFVAEGGLQLQGRTFFQVAALILGAALIGSAAGRRPDGPLYGSAALIGLGALALLTGISVKWSLQPAASWEEANIFLGYAAIFGGGVALARLAPGSWAGLLYGALLGLTVVAIAALATKVFPGTLNPDELFPRLREPFGYWNAVGLTAALGIPLATWLGTRREASRAEQIISFPLVTAFAVTLMLTFSRGSIIAAVLGIGVWLYLVPLRLRTVSLLAGALVPAAGVVAWAFTRESFTEEGAALALRSDDGTVLAILLVIALVISVAIGFAALSFRDRRPLAGAERDRTGRLVARIAAGLAVAGLLAFLVSGGGPSERVSTVWDDLTSETAETPKNDPSRLTSASSIRASYWRDAGRVFGEHTLKGAGGGAFDTVRFRYRKNTFRARHAHGYVPQVLADLGLIGLGLSLAVLAAWLVAARRPLRTDGLGRETPEQIGVAAIAVSALVFGFHSAIDWTWYVPALAGLGLLCAGWLAGRGPLAGDGAVPARLGVPGSAVVAVVATVAAVIGIYAVVQPWKASERSQEALELAQNADATSPSESAEVDPAREKIKEARDINPLSVEPLFDLAAIEEQVGRTRTAEKALVQAVRLQPANHETWLNLGRFRLDQGDQKRAIEALAAAVYLDPRGPRTRDLYVDALRAFEALGQKLPPAP